MRKLTVDEINKISSKWEKNGANKEIVETFLANMGTNLIESIGKLCDEGKREGWNEKTIMAVLEGIDQSLW